jgi:glycerol transport system ATP-binding protein
VRPEFVRLTRAPDGLPANIRRVEDVGRHKIVRADSQGDAARRHRAEDEDIPADAHRVAFDPERINVYPTTGAWRPQGGRLMNKTVNQKAWFLVLPVLMLVAFSASSR